MHLGKRLLRVRTLRSLNQEEMGKLLGLSQRAYAAYEKKETFNIKTAKEWSKILKIDLLAKDFIETQEQYDNLVNESREKYITTPTNTNDIIATLTKSNEKLIDNNNIVVKSNEKLVNLLENKLNTPFDQRLFQDMTAMLRAYKHFLQAHVIDKVLPAKELQQELDKLKNEALTDNLVTGNSFA